MENRNERLIKVLNVIIYNIYKSAKETNDETERDIYIVQALTLHSVIWLLMKDKYLELLEKRYDIK